MNKHRLRAAKTIPEYARERRIGEGKVYEWIAKGELRAVNMASDPGKRPRYILLPEDIADFERRREVVPVAPRERPRRSAARRIPQIV